jgi:tetratricopeptide (TPR) repeat protein
MMMPVRTAIVNAYKLMTTGKAPEALTVLKRAQRDAPRSRRLLETLAKVYFVLDDHQQAEQMFRQSLDVMPTTDTYHVLIQLLLGQSRFSEASELLEEALKGEPDHGGLWVDKGDFMLRQGRLEEAIEAYERAKAIDPYRATSFADERIEIARQNMNNPNP